MDLKGHRELTLAKEQQQQRMLSDSQLKVQQLYRYGGHVEMLDVK